jgi:hypothetical protein
MTMRDRVKELRRVPASELRANPKNWRTHPPAQEAAMRGILEDIGFADAMIARETDDGLELIDGHLRQEVMGDQPVPVLIVDVTEEEADKMLLTLDPLAAMARPDQDQLLSLLKSVEIESDAVNIMLEALINGESEPLPYPGTTPTLEELTDTYGDLDDELLWPVIRLRVSPHLKGLFDSWLDTGEGETEAARLENLLSE